MLSELRDKNSVNRPDCLLFGIISRVATWEHVLMNESESQYSVVHSMYNISYFIHSVILDTTTNRIFYHIRRQKVYTVYPESQCQCRDYGLIKFNGMPSPRQSVQFLSGSNPAVAGKSHIRSLSDPLLPQ